MPRPQKEIPNREFITIRIYYKDYQKLAKMGRKDTSFAKIMRGVMEIITKIKREDMK